MADNFGLKIGLEGEKEFRKSLSEINSAFKVLGSEMKLVESQFAKNDTSVDALTAKNSVLEKSIDAQKKKIETLKAALANAAESFGENDKRTQAWQIQLNNAEAELNKMDRELKENKTSLDKSSDEFDDAGKKADKFSDEMKKSGDTTETAGDKFKKVGTALKDIGAALGTAMAAVGTAAVAAGKKLFDTASETANAGDEIDKTSQKLGMSYKAYQEWDYVLGQSGVEITSMTTGLKTLTNQIDDAKGGSEKATERFKKLGISMEDLKTMSREDVFSAVVTGMQSMEDSTERAALANDLFGKSGQNLAPLFNQTVESTQELKDAASELGFIMSDDAVKASADFNDSLDTLTRTFSGVKNNIMGELLPAFTEIMTGLSELLAGSDGAKEKIQNGTQELVTSLSAVLPGIVDILMTLVGAVAEIAPVILDSLIQGIVENLPQIVTAASEIVVSFLNSLIEALPQIAEGALQLTLTLVNGILTNLPRIIEVALQVVAQLALGIAQALPTLIPTIIDVVVQICQNLVNNLPLILDAALQLVTGLTQGILDAIPVLIGALPELILSIINFLLNSIPQIIDTGIKLITSLVSALPQIISEIVKVIPQIISGIITAVINAIPQIIQAGIKLLISLVQALPTIILTVVKAIPEIVNGIVDAVMNNLDKIIGAGVDLFVALIENLPTIIKEIVKAVPQIISGLVKAFGNITDKMAEVGGNIVKGLWNGIQGLADWLWEKVSGWISGIWDGICDFFGIASPSKKFAWAGKMMVNGLAGSIEDNGDEAVEAVQDMSDGISGVLDDLSRDMQTTMPEKLSIAGSIDDSDLHGITAAGNGFRLELHIGTFNNYSSEDIEQLTNEIMVTAGQFARRKEAVFA